MADRLPTVYPILLAGGSGTRLWPVSRELYPKQLVSFIGKDSLVQSTIKRLLPVVPSENIRVVCGEEHVYEIARHMGDIGVVSDGKIIREPCGRNTAPAILLAALTIAKHESDAIVCAFPADHVIRNIAGFHRKLSTAVHLAEKGHIVTFGIQPHFPETGYGYIEGGEGVFEDALAIKRFVEKPDMKTAQQYVAAGNFYWNSGMFTFKLSVILDEFTTHAPELLRDMKHMTVDGRPITKTDYEKLPDISIDYAIMEKTGRGVVLPSDFGWSDIGSWKSLYDFLPKDKNGNVIDGDVINEDTHNCIIIGYERLIATNCLHNMVVIETPDSVFVSDMARSRDVKSIVTRLKETGRSEYRKHRTVYHAWGNIILLENSGDHSVSRLAIYPEQKLRIEADAQTVVHLAVISGTAAISDESPAGSMTKGESLTIPGGHSVVLENAEESTLSIIQTNCRLDG
jgi:mannose-1-phosphate guanylyltransferase